MTSSRRRRALLPLLALPLAVALGFAPAVRADHTPDPTMVTLPGSFQSEMGCPGDWDPACLATALMYSPDNEIWVGNLTVPAGNWEYRVAINRTWDESYGAGGVQDGANLLLSVASEQIVTFTYDHHTHVVAHNVTPIVSAPGTYQSEVGCPGDWIPDCLISQLFDADLDGVFTYVTAAIPPGNYEFKIVLGLSWDINYGEGGVPNGLNVGFEVPEGDALVTFSWDSSTLAPSVVVESMTPATRSSWGRLKSIYR